MSLIAFRLDESGVDKLDAIASRLGRSRSDVLRLMISESSVPDRRRLLLVEGEDRREREAVAT